MLIHGLRDSPEKSGRIENFNTNHAALIIQLKMLPVTIFKEADYRSEIPKAEKLLRDRDPDDVFLLALALKEKTPIWSNDRDFEHLPMPVYTTAYLLKILESKRFSPS